MLLAYYISITYLYHYFSIFALLLALRVINTFDLSRGEWSLMFGWLATLLIKSEVEQGGQDLFFFKVWEKDMCKYN